MPRKDPEQARAYQAAYRAAHREESVASIAVWRAAHREEIAAYNATYHAAHREERAVYQAAYNATHRKERVASATAWKKTHPAHARAICAQRRARKHNAPINDFTAAQWRDMQAAFDHRCAYCHKRCKGRLTQDHIQPLSKGGAHTYSNIVPACRSCNSKKHVGPPLVPVQPLLLL